MAKVYVRKNGKWERTAQVYRRTKTNTWTASGVTIKVATRDSNGKLVWKTI